jgi:hypothetical protein
MDYVIFGTTSFGEQLRASLGPDDRALCFATDDRTKVATRFGGLNVVHPAWLLEISFDRVLVATDDRTAALTFLLRLGIPIEKIDAAVAPSAPQHADPRPTAVIYGSGIEALRTLQHLKDSYRVLCFCDPNGGMHGKRVAGHWVLPPADLRVLAFDRIFIGVSDTYRAVHDLLWGWSVPIERMDVVPEHVLLKSSSIPTLDHPRCVIFGAGSAGEQAFAHVPQGHEVIAFIDNNPARHGTEFCGRRVYGPETLRALEYDRLVIASAYSREILTQLSAMGLDRGEIQVWGQGAPPEQKPQASPSFLSRFLRKTAVLS